MQFAPPLLALLMLAAGISVSLIGWRVLSSARCSIERRLFDAQWGELVRYGGLALAGSGLLTGLSNFGA